MSGESELELVRGVKSGVEGEGGVGCGMEEGTGGAGLDDVARSVFHVHRDRYVLRSLCKQEIDSEKSSSTERSLWC